MSGTEEFIAIFIFKNDCPACMQLKSTKYNSERTIYEEIRHTLVKKGISIIEFYLHQPSMPSFLKVTSFYPTTFLIPKRIYVNWENTPEHLLYSSIAVFSSSINRTEDGKYRVGKYTGRYAFNVPNDYGTFVNDYMSGLIEKNTFTSVPKQNNEHEVKTRNVYTNNPSQRGKRNYRIGVLYQ